MSQQAPDIGVVEQSLLSAIRERGQHILTYLPTIQMNPSPAWLNGLDTLINELQALLPQALSLQAQGRPQALQLLQAALADTRQARIISAQTIQNQIQTDWNCWRIQQDANRYVTDTILEANQNARASSERSLQNWFDVTENRCYRCHRLIDIPGGGYCVDCARQLGWI